MTKSDLINVVHQRQMDAPEGASIESVADGSSWRRREVEQAVNTIFDAMTDALVEQDRIEIRGLGSFRVKVRQARKGRNPRTGAEVTIPARMVPTFLPGKRLRALKPSRRS